MKHLLTRVKRHPFATFVVLAFALSWWPALLAQGTMFPYGPSLAALIVLAITAGRSGVGDLWRRMRRWRVGFGWYAVAAGLPVALMLITVALTVLLGGSVPTEDRLPGWSFLTLTMLPLLLTGGQWEEPGWRGYAQPALERGRSALRAALLLGAIWGPWHLPLMLDGRVPWSDLVWIPAVSVVYAWLSNSTGGSLPIAMVLHYMLNVTGILGRRLVGDADVTLEGWVSTAVWCAAALVVVLLNGPSRLARPTSANQDGDGTTTPMPTRRATPVRNTA